MNRSASWWILPLLLILALLVFNPGQGGGLFDSAQKVPYTTFKSLVSEGAIEEVTITGNRVTATLTEPQS
ncbi:MAG: hypothetical protein GWN87_32115, partial [Desulfuromonadales bacterium]|nr:hypothetical protein [Desulfuromonadales bacterium]NIS40950.1 hypothetical protein [Desulfuromonadales bacterium]